MEHKPIKLLGLFVALIFVMACSLVGGGSTQVPEEATAPEATEQVEVTEESTAVPVENTPTAETSHCDNPYYPIREGSTWNYKGVSSMAPSYTYTDTVTSIRSDGYTLTSQFEGLTRTQEWACTPEGLVALQMGGGLNTAGMNLKVETQNASGVTYPAEMNAGDTWQYKLDFTGKMDIAGQSGDATGSTQSDFTALGMENVTVPAGTFDAMKVQVATTLNINVNFQGLSVPVNFTNTSISWYAEGVGWVKSESSGDFAGQSFSETIELQWYNIP